MGKRRNKKMINVLTASLASAILLGTSTTNSLAYEDSATETSATDLTAQQQENSPVAHTYTVTLVTGDVVYVEKHNDGTLVCTLQPREDGSEEPFITKSIDEGFYVIPNKATPFLAAGQLDEELFNIKKLIEYGYDDSHQESIPMIVTEEFGKVAPSVSEAADEAVTTGATEKVELQSVNAVAVKTDKKHAKKFWEAVDGQAVTVTNKAKPELTDGIKKIWLDKPVHVLLDKSVPQIGAPTAWASGYDGKGVKVAVLDTGIDPNHPDLKNVIKEEKSFIDGEDFVDHHGHGTHVASTIAGSGAASGGKMKGVAPGAELIIGKVLSNAGSGSESAIIAGMEWAVQEKADIVSMSLGGSATDGTDPMSQAVNNLSATSNTLFVIAAGNAGSAPNTVGAPGAAEKALTVGAVDKSDFLASFSSRGPVLKNNRVKPEITAPGVGIVAARAAGTSLGTPVDANYSSLNGTSMATPHVAGAAAILKQRHPDWTGDHIKQVLTSTAVVPKPQIGVYEQGAGRVSIPDALDATVYSSPAVVSMGAGMVDDKPIEKIFTYVNPTDSEVTLNLTTSLTAPGFVPEADKAKIFTLDKSVVTVPAHGSSQVKATFNPLYGNVGNDRLVVTATPSAGVGNKIKTTIGATKTVPLVNVTINKIDRNGNPAGAFPISALNLDTGEQGSLNIGAGTDTIRLKPGHWSLMTYIPTTLDGVTAQNFTLVGETNVELVYKQDKTIIMDARMGEEVKVVTPKESESGLINVGFTQKAFTGLKVGVMFNAPGRFRQHFYAVPTKPVKDFEFIYQQRKFAPQIKASYDGYGGSLPVYPVMFVPKLNGNKTLKAVYIGKGSPEELSGKDVRGKLAVAIRDVTKKPGQQINAIASSGAEAVILVNDRPGPYSTEVFRADNVAIPAWTLGDSDGAVLIDRIANGPTNINFKGTPNSPYAYNYATVIPGGIPAGFSEEITEENSEVVNTHYRSNKKWLHVGETNSAFRSGENITQWVEFFENAPLDREEWYSTGSKSPVKEMRWLHTVYPDAGKNYLGNTVRNMKSAEFYAPGTKREETWMGAGLGLVGPEKGIVGKSIAYRQGDTFNLNILEQGDSEPTHYGTFDYDDDVVKMRVYQDGMLKAENKKFVNTKVPVSANPANYKITVDTSRLDWFPLSTKTSTAWTFKSERTANGDIEHLGLLWPKYGFDLDMENKAMRGITDHFDLSFILQSLDTPNMNGVEAAVSTDDGNTWSNTKVEKRENGHYTVTVKNPDSGYVSIRIKATDMNGNQVEQTLIRAYAVREK
ncbi:S8 family peptidase [Gottfriedia acidiceleris]|uniref:S8 family peptidase n=1 Tax=Gottfriedia acidiceleris TaxID=371036 RepID=UPI00101CE782|nr:S8 family serine peptidase [Gottfriedia acidiceleris]